MAMTSNVTHRNVRPSSSSLPEQSLSTHSQHTSISIVQFNARSLLPKMTELRHVASTLRPHIIAVTETWLSASVPRGATHIDGYNVQIRTDRAFDRRGGGTLLLIHNGLNVQERSDLIFWPESTWVEIKTASQKLVVGCLYRPPSGNPSAFTKALESSFLKIDPRQKIVLVGDFNATCPAWCSTDSFNEAGRILEPALLTLGLHQHVSSPTHVRPDGNLGGLLDVVLTNDESMVSAVNIHPPIGLSDHMMVECLLTVRKPSKTALQTHRTNTIWCYGLADQDQVNNALNEADWQGVRNAENIDDAWTSWQSTFHSIVKSLIPSKTIKKISKKNPFVTPEIALVIKEKRSAFRRYKNSPSPELRRIFCDLRNKVTKVIRKGERAHVSTLHRTARLCPSPTSSRDFWRYIQQITGKVRQTMTSDLIDPTTQERACSPQEKANLFNVHFTRQTMLGVPPEAKPDPSSLQSNPRTFSYLETTPSDVFTILSTLKTNKAPGVDGISPGLLRFCARGIACSLTCLFNRSFELSQFPQAWKYALVIPVHKKGGLSDPGNYRPIALLPTISKVLERIVHNKLSSFLGTWLSNKQSGFRKGDGTVPQLVRLTQQWSEAIDQSKYVGVIFCDLKKAFDKVWHLGLMTKLHSAGIRGSALNWFQRYLEGRCQITMVNGYYSPPAEIQAGVPQGAILSPLMFSIYINDIVYTAAPVCDINLFADDTSASVVSKSPTELNNKLQIAADSISRWFDRWFLVVNTAKTVSMAIRSRGMPHCSLSLTINDQTIPQCDSHRHLGIVISSTLSWREHTRMITCKAAQKIGLMRRLRRSLTPTVLLAIYRACIRPTLEYASLAWCGLSGNDSVRLERCQRSAARLICGISPLSGYSHDSILARAGLQPLSVRRQLHQALFVRKIVTDRLPLHLRESVAPWIAPPRESLPRRSARRTKFNLDLPRPKKNCLKCSPFYLSFVTWNRAVYSINPVDLPPCQRIKEYFDV